VYGRIDATEEDILHAVARAGLSDFLRALPAGLDTMLGEKGAKLSTVRRSASAGARISPRCTDP